MDSNRIPFKEGHFVVQGFGIGTAVFYFDGKNKTITNFYRETTQETYNYPPLLMDKEIHRKADEICKNIKRIMSPNSVNFIME